MWVLQFLGLSEFLVSKMSAKTDSVLQSILYSNKTNEPASKM